MSTSYVLPSLQRPNYPPATRGRLVVWGLLASATVAATPYLPWAYRPKVEDFAASLGVQDYCVRTDAGPDRLSLAWNKLERDEQWFQERQRTGVEQMRRQLREFARQVARDLTSKVVPAGSPTHRSSEDPVH